LPAAFTVKSMVNVGDLVNNVGQDDYNYGMVLETELDITEELLAAGSPIELADLEAVSSGCEPPGARVLWDTGEIDIHYTDELEVVNDERKQRVV